MSVWKTVDYFRELYRTESDFLSKRVFLPWKRQFWVVCASFEYKYPLLIAEIHAMIPSQKLVGVCFGDE
jgi:hypothetical protein